MTRPTRVAQRHMPAFTLIELLVVISIISILVSILLPALAKARDQTKAAQCLANQRQFVFAASAYAEEHKGWAPAFYNPPASLNLYSWYYVRSPFWKYIKPNKYNPTSSSVMSLAPFNCPMIDQGAWDNAPYFYGGGIGITGRFFWWDDGNAATPVPNAKRLYDLRRPAKFGLFADNVGNLFAYNNDIDYRHGMKRWTLGINNIGNSSGFANAGFADGHAGTVRYADNYFWNGVNRGKDYWFFYWDKPSEFVP